MERDDPPIERRYFETREQEAYYVAVARGFKNATEMRDHYKTHPLPGRAVETRSADADVYARRLTVLKLSEVE